MTSERTHSVGRVLALDVGEARIGIAVSDPTGLLATPLAALRRSEHGQDVESVLEVAEREGATCIVVGMPLTMSGERSRQTRKVLAFTDTLRARSPLRVELWDERLSTVEAEALLRSAGVRPSHDRARLDSAAAAVILRWYLEAHRAKASE